MTEVGEILNTNFKKVRKSIGLNQTAMGAILGLKRCTVGAIEELRAELSPTTIKELCKHGFVLQDKLFDFMFRKTFEPKTKIKFRLTYLKNKYE